MYLRSTNHWAAPITAPARAGGSHLPTIRRLAEALGLDPHEIVAED